MSLGPLGGEMVVRGLEACLGGRRCFRFAPWAALCLAWSGRLHLSMFGIRSYHVRCIRLHLASCDLYDCVHI